jgi:ABC-type lipoprotein release transport system permease subunit
LNDLVTIRFETVYGQSQAPKFKVVGIIPSENMFMDMASFVDMETLRGLLNLRPEECLGLNILTPYPENQAKTIAQANKLHAALAPGAAGLKGTIRAGEKQADAEVFALKLKTDPSALATARDNLRFVEGDLESLERAEDGILLTEPLARQLGAGTGSRLKVSYVPSYEAQPVEMEAEVRGVIEPPASFARAAAFAHEELFYRAYFRNLPREPAVAAHDAPLYKALLPEWELLERSKDTDAAMKKSLKLGREPWKGARVDVQTMFETASAIVDLQRGLNTVSIVAVLVLFFVILIGVVNTMRMSIRERTREIGTNRAIGMQRADVRSVFVLEIVFLAVLAAAVGILLGFGLIALLSSFTFELKDNPFSLFFINKHLHFMPTALAIVSNFLIIVVIAFLIAFFTARRAARMRAAEALRHYE